MTDADRLQKAIELAVKAHAGQYRDNGEPFILHPLRVMLKVRSIHEKIVAILHDVVEDSQVTLENIKTILELDDLNNIEISLKQLTRLDSQLYEDYIINISLYTTASRVKLADLTDNLDMTSYEKTGDLQVRRFKKHHKAYKILDSFRYRN